MHRRRARPAAAARAGRPFSVRSLGAGRRSAAGWLLRSVKVRRCSIPKAPNPIEMVPTPTVCGVRSACTWRRSVAAHLSAKSLTASIHSSRGTLLAGDGRSRAPAHAGGGGREDAPTSRGIVTAASSPSPRPGEGVVPSLHGGCVRARAVSAADACWAHNGRGSHAPRVVARCWG